MKIYPYLRNYLILLVASRVLTWAAIVVSISQWSDFTIAGLQGNAITLSLHQFQFIIFWIINSFVMLFIKTDFDRNKIKAPWILVITIFAVDVGIVISWLLLYLANRDPKQNEYRTSP